jgi:hypothetical protein
MGPGPGLVLVWPYMCTEVVLLCGFSSGAGVSSALTINNQFRIKEGEFEGQTTSSLQWHRWSLIEDFPTSMKEFLREGRAHCRFRRGLRRT